MSQKIVFAAISFFPRGRRLVAETEKPSFNAGFSSSLEIMVDLPVPEGADMIIIFPFFIYSRFKAR